MPVYGTIASQFNDPGTNELYKTEKYLKPEKGDSVLQQIADSLITDKPDVKDQLKSIYNYVSQNFIWDSTTKVFNQTKILKIHEDRKGSSTEMNMLLVKLLQYVNIEANPILISTRENGKVIKEYPFLTQFNKILI